MRRIEQFVVDAFTDRVFGGNPAAVCVLDSWLPDRTMQDIAIENNLSETAFAVPDGEAYGLRWFTPGGEVDLCGHATLAAASVVMKMDGTDRVVFRTASGDLPVTGNDGLYEMDFPAYTLRKVDVTDEMTSALGAEPSEAYIARDLLCVFDDEDTVRNMEPDLRAMMNLDGLLVQVTAPGSGVYDCVSRSFAPKLRIPEDPVCGSGHCHIVPYWASRLGRSEIRAYQASARGGDLMCAVRGDRVSLAGRTAMFSRGELFLPDDCLKSARRHPCRMSEIVLNPNCNCPKTDCPRHGNCMECVEFHKANSDKIPFCLRFMIEKN